MNAEMAVGFIIVAFSLAVLAVLVFVSRARIERIHREGFAGFRTTEDGEEVGGER